MRTIFAIAALAASASAVKMDKIPKGPKPPMAEPTDAAESNSNCNLVESSTWMTQQNEGFSGSFRTPYQWYNMMENFWNQFNTTEAFQYFDCVHGNSDGLVDFSEYNLGLYNGGYVPDANCSADYLEHWQNSFGVGEGVYIINEDFYCGGNTNNIEDQWCQLGGFCDNDSVNHNDFLVNSMRMGADLDEAQTAWMAAIANNKRRHKGTVHKDGWMQQQNATYHGMWQFLEDQMVAVPLPGMDEKMLPVQMWYFSQTCFAAESYWTALSWDPSYLAWNSPISYTLHQFQSQLCQAWDLCED